MQMIEVSNIHTSGRQQGRYWFFHGRDCFSHSYFALFSDNQVCCLTTKVLKHIVVPIWIANVIYQQHCDILCLCPAPAEACRSVGGPPDASRWSVDGGQSDNVTMSRLLVKETGASHHKSSAHSQPNSESGNTHAHVHLKIWCGYTSIHFSNTQKLDPDNNIYPFNKTNKKILK